jgi:YVTN family beta-propeller protein
MRKLLSLSVIVSAAACAVAFASVPARAAEPAGGGYHVVKTLPVGGEGRWDYITVDPATALLYVPRQSHTLILRADTGKMVADLKDTPGVHGVALAPDAGRGFTSNGGGNSVTVFDLKTHQVIGTVAVGQKPDAIVYDPASKSVFAMNGKSETATAIDAAAPLAQAVKATIPLGGGPESAAADGRGRVYVNLEDKNEVVVIDTKAMKVAATWKIDGGESPAGLAIDPVYHHLFSGCHNQVMAILDTQTGKTLGTVPIGKGVDFCGFDPATGEAFASCGDGTLTVVKETAPGKFEAVQTVQTRQGARTMALDTTTHTIYLPTAKFEAPAPGQKRPAMKPGSFMIVVVAPQGQ